MAKKKVEVEFDFHVIPGIPYKDAVAFLDTLTFPDAVNCAVVGAAIKLKFILERGLDNNDHEKPA